MTRTILTVAALLCGTAAATAQTVSPVAPAAPSTNSDTRRIDQAQSPPIGSTETTSPATTGNTNSNASPAGTQHWRASDGLNNDPNNPSGMPK